MLTTILILIIGVSIIYLIFFLSKRLPDLKNLDIASISEEKQKAIKERILQAKLTRHTAVVKEKLSKVLSPQKKFFLMRVKKIKDRISDLESKYQIGGKPDELLKDKKLEELLQEAEDLIYREDFVLGEKYLIEVISRDRKNITAYELLGDLYFNNKNYDQAEEIFKYLLKLNAIKDRAYDKLGMIALKKDQVEEAELDFLKSLNINNKVASYYDNLAQVYEISGKNDKALDCYLKATVIEPNSPKYLDRLIEASIKIGDKGLAKKTYNQLKKINPENGKLPDFAERIEKVINIC